ncbi:uncharacterized membrane protein YcaP (DUF421 family) [Pedobacter sp. W3I1]|uniref:DUF421 domain-containing protein n=1 Tax=Pedobacter sp. W3I1 TaxID=3042291 RepID=UPI00277EC353|nr:YetF domain-containing protein [Pedobacter sp. W3I1]MDQ0638475.1 uncharacterized membrane protein YcaP (DUF421 family) [Pedobacter sp. W3I1]
MKEYEIKLTDIQRILQGEIPMHFFIEVIFRTAAIYLILMVSMRLMGKRMSSQLSRNEMAAVASLAAAVGVPLMNPDRGLLPAVVIAAVIITLQILIAKIAANNIKFESLTQDKYNMLIKDGVMNPKAMVLTRITKDRVLSQLRSEGISHLGMVKRLYFEASGTFSCLKNTIPVPGLSTIPNWDHEMSEKIHSQTAIRVCESCGAYKQDTSADKCQNCEKNAWVYAVSNLKDIKG